MFVMVLSCLSLGLGQSTQPARVASVELAEPYFDGSYGFSIRAPAGWEVIRRREPMALATVLLRMVESTSALDPRVFIVEHITSSRPLTIEDRLRLAVAGVAMELPDAKVETKALKMIDGRPGATLAASYPMGDQTRFRLLSIVEIAPRNYLMLRCDGAGASRASTEPIYQAVLESLKLLASPLSDEALKEALDAGAKWIESVNGEALKKALASEQYFVFEVGGKPVGFVEIYQRASTFKMHDRRHEGIEIYEQSWTFEGEKVARRQQNRMFLGNDLVLEKWQTSTSTWLKADGDRLEQFENAYEEGLRDHDVLVSGQTPSFSVAMQQNSPLKLPRTYVSRVLVRLLPRLIDKLAEARRLAFVSFDHERAGLIVRVLEFTGASALPGADGSKKAFKIEDREGVAAEPAEVYVDEKGNVLLVKTRALTMRPGTLDELKRLFEPRVLEGDEAMARMEQAFDQSQSRFIGGR